MNKQVIQPKNSNHNHMLRYFEYKHLPEGPLRDTSKRFHEMANELYENIPGGFEKTAGMRKLLEAKDCFVRACIPE